MGSKKMVPLIECSSFPNFGKTGKLRIKNERVKKGMKK